MDEMMEILKNLDWSPLFISIKTGIVATIFSVFSWNLCGTQGCEDNSGEKGDH